MLEVVNIYHRKICIVLLGLQIKLSKYYQVYTSVLLLLSSTFNISVQGNDKVLDGNTLFCDELADCQKISFKERILIYYSICDKILSGATAQKMFVVLFTCGGVHVCQPE